MLVRVAEVRKRYDKVLEYWEGLDACELYEMTSFQLKA
jgi:hypothetical protein